MFTFEGTIKDAYGLVHVDPVFAVKQFNNQQTQDLSGFYDTKQNEQSFNDNKYQYSNFTVVYWTNQAAKDEGAQPIMFIDNNASANFNMQPEVAYPTPEEALAAIEEYFLENVLPQFTVEGVE